MTESPAKIALLATVPSTLAVFYRPLIEALLEAGLDLTLIASPGPELDQFEQSGRIRVRRVKLVRGIAPWSDLAAVAALTRLFRAERFQLIHTHTPKAGLVGMIAGRLAGVPHRIHTLHGLPLETACGWRRCILAATERTTSALADVVFVVSDSLRQRVIDLRLCQPDKMTILGHGSACGVDLQRFQRSTTVEQAAGDIRRRLNIAPGTVVIGYVGWMVADKGVAELVEAFGHLASRRSNLHLLLLGPEGGKRDPLPAAVLDTIAQHPRITYVGNVTDPVPYYAATDVCVLPTRREGFPYALLEAAAMGVPTIATRATGCVDAVVDRQTGLLVPLGDRDALGEAMGLLAEDEPLRRRLGAAGRKRAAELFDCRRLVAEHLRVYQALLTPAIGR